MLLAAASEVKAQEFNVMFYNVENLFDTADDTTRNDDEFLPGGDRHWTERRYWQKINALSRVVAAAGEWEQPALIGLCEVENEKVVSDLANRSILEGTGYRVIHRDSPDSRGIDVALLYRADLITIMDCRSWAPVEKEGEVFNSRNLLYVKALIGKDTLHIILCHWPSRRGGTLAAADVRKSMAQLARTKTDSLQASSGDMASIIVMGDFNATPADEIIRELTEGSCLENLSRQKAEKGEGSYKYQGTWEMIDQIFVSKQMRATEGPFIIAPESFRVFETPFLLAEDPDYPGKKPFATYTGYRYAGGYSDHLPVMITLKKL